MIQPGMQRAILADLGEIEEQEGIRILFAVESGSRAWGFPSPDSDYDVRFVYARPLDDYLALRPPRDVVERPLRGELDVNGWDIRKALLLLLKPNPVLLEWLASPIFYRWDERVCAELTALGERTAFASACRGHYLSLAARLFADDIDGRDRVRLKKYLYVLRPALCLAWLRERPGLPPPMNLQDLAAGVTIASELDAAIVDLLARKAEASEIGEGSRLAAIDAFVAEQLAWAQRQTRETLDPGAYGHLLAEANNLFRRIVRGEV
jgi:uncharacterized protein